MKKTQGSWKTFLFWNYRLFPLAYTVGHTYIVFTLRLYKQDQKRLVQGHESSIILQTQLISNIVDYNRPECKSTISVRIKEAEKEQQPYSRKNKPCLFKTYEVFGGAYFRAMLVFETWLFKIFRHYFSKYVLYFGWFQCIQIFLCLNYTFWVYCYALISTFIPKKYVTYVSTAIFSAEEI